MTPDFTLIIPTFNRPKQVVALVNYLLRSNVPWHILVVNSGELLPEIGTLAAGHAGVSVLQYARETHPFDKFLDGARGVKTEFCGICADDDIVVPSGVNLCIRVLRDTPVVSAAMGHAFGFETKDGVPAFQAVLRVRDSITDPIPLQRVAQFIGEYRALTYAVYRTKDMIAVLKPANDMPSLLGRELLAGALSAVQGQLAVVPCFSHGRSVAVTEHHYRNWHPTNWFLGNADEMMREYTLYRAMLVMAIHGHTDNTFDETHIKNCLNLIHLRYLINYFPANVLDGTIENKCSGVDWQQWLPEMRRLMDHVDSGALAILGSNSIEEVTDCLKLYGQT